MKIYTYPDDILRKKTTPVTNFDEALRQTIREMIQTMYEANGVGLAAPQVGISKRLFVIDDSPERNHPQVFINPEIIDRQGKIKSEEGCLSFPELTADVIRAEKVTVRAKDPLGNEFTLEAEDLLSRALQHELDHLDNILLIDLMSRTQKIKAKKKLDYLK